MRYLVLGPAAMGIFSHIGVLKKHESELSQVEEISGSSAGAIIALFLAMGYDMDKILDVCLDINISDYTKIHLKSFLSNYGFIDIKPIREKLIKICDGNPTFRELDKKIYISAYCVNTSSTVYFSRDTHPDMHVIDAVCMSMAIPFIFSTAKYQDHTYVDGGTEEMAPMEPFIDKKPHEITCVKVVSEVPYVEKIENPQMFAHTLLLSYLKNRRENIQKGVHVINIDVSNYDIFDFNMTQEEKIKLFFEGYN